MKITHICLCGPVTDNWTYQDNLLPKYHKAMGLDVSVITSQYIWNNNGELDIDDRGIYHNEYGIKTIRIKSKYKTNIHSKFKRFHQLYETISNENPDVLFVHGIQFLDISDVVKFLKRNSHVVTYVDNHADYSNSATNWLSRNILHKVIWRWCGFLIEPYTKRFYGVLPARVEFLKDVYKLPEKKIELLVLGADDDKVKEAKDTLVNEHIRQKHQVDADDFLIITGGKIDIAKRQILLLMKAVKEIKNEKIKLVIFGSVSSNIRDEFDSLVDNNVIKYAGWISSDLTYQYLASSDLAIFPGRHSVIWEQAVGMGVPCIFKYWEGTTHVDVGGNCKFLYNDTVEEIKGMIETLLNNPAEYTIMKNKAETIGTNSFLYSKIAEKSIKF